MVTTVRFNCVCDCGRQTPWGLTASCTRRVFHGSFFKAGFIFFFPKKSCEKGETVCDVVGVSLWSVTA